MVKTCGKPVKYFGKNLAIVTVPAAYTKTFTENWVNKQSFLFWYWLRLKKYFF